VLEQLVAANNDATLEELRDQLKQQTDVLIGRSTVDRMLTKLNLTVKKNTASH
jgi:transposase